MSKETKNRMQLSELEKTREYARLTPKQKMFVQTYVGAGDIDGNYDAVAAVNTAYKCKSDEVARIMSYALMTNINIIVVLNRHFGNEPIDAFLAALDRAIHNKRLTLAQLGALRLQCDVMGFGTKIPANPEFGLPPISPSHTTEGKKTPKTQEAGPKPAPLDPATLDPHHFD